MISGIHEATLCPQVSCWPDTLEHPLNDEALSICPRDALLNPPQLFVLLVPIQHVRGYNAEFTFTLDKRNSICRALVANGIRRAEGVGRRATVRRAIKIEKRPALNTTLILGNLPRPAQSKQDIQVSAMTIGLRPQL